MRIEHVAFNVPDPLAVARWYVEHLGFEVKRRIVDPPFAHFLADSTGQVMIEIYGRDDVAAPDYTAQHPATLLPVLLGEDLRPDEQARTEDRGIVGVHPHPDLEGTRFLVDDGADHVHVGSELAAWVGVGGEVHRLGVLDQRQFPLRAIEVGDEIGRVDYLEQLGGGGDRLTSPDLATAQHAGDR